MDEHETIADVIAWLRRPREGENAYLIAWRDEIADRLEAAHKRDTKELRVEIERLKEERNYSGVRERERLRADGFAIVPKEQLERGDAAKLREAVKETQAVIAKCMDILNSIPDSCGYDGLIDDVADELCDLREQYVKPALAEPVRNCDVIGNTGRALAVHGFPTKGKPWGEGEWLKLIDWLFAPYEEGGAK